MSEYYAALDGEWRNHTGTVTPGNEFRMDPMLEPYHEEHFWNMPIGQDAVLQDLNLCTSANSPVVFRPEKDIIFLTPDGPKLQIFDHNAGWSITPRCSAITTNNCDNIEPYNPAPLEVMTFAGDWNDDNQSACILYRNASGDIVRVETQPLIFCNGVPYSKNGRPAYLGGYIDNRANAPVQGANGQGVEAQGVGGAHGGSRLEAFGGTIRLHEVENREINHVLKFCVAGMLWLVSSTLGRWPAMWTDSYSLDYGSERPAGTGGAPAGAKMGMLATVLPTFNLDNFDTAAGHMLGRTLYDFGAICSDSSRSHDAFYFALEQGPNGDGEDVFADEFGHAFKCTPSSTGTLGLFYDDMVRLIQGMHVVNDNSSTNVGGAGARRRALIPPLHPSVSGD